MVEFGLKLEDNKVSEWGHRYLDYEALKKILKKAKKAQKKYDDVCDENKAEAEVVTKAYRSGAYDDRENIPPIKERDNAQNKKEGKHADPQRQEEKASVDEETGHATERSALLKRQESKIVSALTNMLSNTAEERYDFEEKVRSFLEEIDNQTMAFDDLIYEQQKKVVSFYYSQLQELQGRLEFLLESVYRDPDIQKLSIVVDDEDGTDFVSSEKSPFPWHRRKKSSIGETFEGIINHLSESVRSIGHQNDSGRHSNKIPLGIKTKSRVGIIQLGKRQKATDKSKTKISGATDEDYEDDPDWDHEDVAKAESIKRSLVDQYRIAKLLQNYAMMNVTGFVKIIKKFDKTIPLQSGRFQSALESQAMLNDARAVERLSMRYEEIYAHWFCTSDMREAKAQMLVKRGDGLDMDWSQLRLGYRMGMCAILALWVCWDMVWGMIKDGKSTIGARHAFPVFRACGGLLLLQWFWGCSVFMWTRYRVNYIFLFDFNPRIVQTPLEIITDAVDNTLLFMFLMLVSF